MTKLGCPVAQPRLSRRPSARMMTPWPSGKMNLQTGQVQFPDAGWAWLGLNVG